ncbi:MAG: zinc dependent phospholipase C family protein [Bacteroidota bacterium]|nr:zinc dependent phospholipase C family protein [Bacteroidota bacterium]
MKSLTRVGLLAGFLIFCTSWGFLVHRTINQLAIYQLPKNMQPFFYENMDSIVKNSIRPDQRRNKDSTEGAKHFIDIEMYGDSAAWKMPMTWNEAVTKYSKDTLFKYGYVPYWIITMKDKLTNAFRNGNADSILFYATDIGHYIGDANVPLHTSVNYDGQLTGQRGLHALWESVIPELELSQYQLYNHHQAKYLEHPETELWQAIRNAHFLLNDMIEKEREVSKQFTDSTKYRIQLRNGRELKYYTATFAKAYAARLQPTINEQLLRSSNLIADFWYTSWVDAGKPDLNGLLKTPFSKAEKKKMKKEFKVYKKEKLIEKNLLISKKDAVIDPSNQ